MNFKRSLLFSLSALILASAVSCGTQAHEDAPAAKPITEAFNNFYYTIQEDSIIYRKGNYAMLLDCETMDSALLCNIPNCSHNSADCIIKALQSENQLPVIYNGCAYFFENSTKIIDRDGKIVLDLSFTLRKYDFEKCEFSDVTVVSGFNANTADGCYLIGSEYYFTTNIGNPKYDEAGNVTSSSGGGRGDLMSIDLDTGNLSDYGELIDNDEFLKEAVNSGGYYNMLLMGKVDNKLYLSINYNDEYVSTEDFEKGKTPIIGGKTFTFDLSTKAIEKYDDHLSMCTMNGFHTYYDGHQNDKVTIENVASGEVFEGPDIISWNAMTVFGGKLWHDNALCYDIKTGEEKKVSSYDYGQVIAEYNDSYIFMGDDGGSTVFEKLPKSDLE